jgi:23S rRNA (uracil1939-C5)-methyltransferase
MSNGLKNLALPPRGGVPTRILTPLYGGNFTTEAAQQLPFVLPGELADPASLSILEPSPARVAPGCVHFGSCGGCHYQHADYPTQLALKHTILQNIFAESSLPALPQIQTVSANPWHYRNRIRVRIEPDASGELRAGYSLRATNDFLPITMCPIAAPLLWRAAEAIVNLAKTDPLAKRWLAITSELELFCNPDESRLQLQFFLRTGEAGKRESSSFSGLCDRINTALSTLAEPEKSSVSQTISVSEATSAFEHTSVSELVSVPNSTLPHRDEWESTNKTPVLTGASATLDPDLNRRARRLWAGTTWSAAGLNYPAAGRTYWLPRGAFFQVNRFLLDRLATLVTAKQSGDLAWDLFAGVGLFTRILADTFTHVIAVEGAEAAINSLQSAVKAQKGIEPIHSSTLDFLRARELQRERPSLVVLDPPRAGLGAEGAQILARIAPPQIVYVSCDPTTLARDLTILSKTYEVVSITLIDLFPQTFHLETLVHLKQRGASKTPRSGARPA